MILGITFFSSESAVRDGWVGTPASPVSPVYLTLSSLFVLTNNHFLEFSNKLTHIWRTRLLLCEKIYLALSCGLIQENLKVKCIILEYKMLTTLLEKELVCVK